MEKKLKLFGANEIVKDLLITIGVSKVVPIFDTLEQAKAD